MTNLTSGQQAYVDKASGFLVSGFCNSGFTPSSAIVAPGMTITGLTEHDSVPWEALPGQMTRLGNDEWRLTDRPWRLPHSYTLQAVRTS